MHLTHLVRGLLLMLFFTVALWNSRADAGESIGSTLESYAPTVETLWKQIQDAAKTVLPELAKTADNARNLGFESQKEALPDLSEKIDAKNFPQNMPFFVFEVSHASLQNLVANPMDLPQFNNQIIFPLTVNGEPKSSVTVRMDDRKIGHVTRFGSRKLIVQLVKRRMEHPDKQSVLIRIPSLNRNYLGFIDGPAANRQLQLVPLFNDYYSKAGETLPAASVFKQLAPEANAMSDAPR